MQIAVRKPELEKFISDQLTAGRFDSAEQLVEAALQRLMGEETDDDFDDLTVAAILRGDAECERGEGRDFADAAAELRKRALGL